MKKNILVLTVFIIIFSGFFLWTYEYMKNNMENKRFEENKDQKFKEKPKEEMVGDDRDEYGCIGSAGYSWCEASKKCIRQWEEKCEISQESPCGVSSCHGIDIICEKTQPIEVCTDLYALGDRCRQYAECEEINGNCQQKKNQKFETCVSCVKECENENFSDPMKLFECESQC